MKITLWLAQHRLSLTGPSGKRILLLERGGFLPREKDNWDTGQVFVESKYKAHETWLDKDGMPFHPGKCGVISRVGDVQLERPGSDNEIRSMYKEGRHEER